MFAKTKVTIIENGPAIIDSSDSMEIQSPFPYFKENPNKVAICRCGKSKNGVWCDGSHAKKSEEKPY